MTLTAPSQLSDLDLLLETRRVVDADRRTTAELLALLGEIDARMLYRAEGHSSLFAYCTHVLHLSEPSAYSRITAARAARNFPDILRRLAAGDVTLTTIALLAAHLRPDNHEALLDATRHKSKREVERIVAALDPQPDIEASIRRQPTSVQTHPRLPNDAPEQAQPATPTTSASSTRRLVKPSVVAPLSPTRYFVKLTVSQETHDKLQRARDLLRHTIPSGDPAAVIDRALTVLLAQVEKTKLGATAGRRSGPARRATGRHVPAAVKRAVWSRDEGRCAFVGRAGRCPETGFLEFHHLLPFAMGGETTVGNLQLRCRSHNAHEANTFFGTLSGQSSRTRSRHN